MGREERAGLANADKCCPEITAADFYGKTLTRVFFMTLLSVATRAAAKRVIFRCVTLENQRRAGIFDFRTANSTC